MPSEHVSTFSVARKCGEVAMVHTLVPSDQVETAAVYGRPKDRHDRAADA